MARKQSVSEDVQGMWKMMQDKEKILFIAQGVLSVLILLMLIGGRIGVVPRLLANRIDLVLVTLLLIVSALRLFPAHKLRIVGYLVCAVAAIILFVVTFL